MTGAYFLGHPVYNQRIMHSNWAYIEERVCCCATWLRPYDVSHSSNEHRV